MIRKTSIYPRILQYIIRKFYFTWWERDQYYYSLYMIRKRWVFVVRWSPSLWYTCLWMDTEMGGYHTEILHHKLACGLLVFLFWADRSHTVHPEIFASLLTFVICTTGIISTHINGGKAQSSWELWTNNKQITKFEIHRNPNIETAKTEQT